MGATKISLIVAVGLLLSGASAFDRQALSSWFTGLRTEKIVHAINCGSYEDVTDLLGVTYKAVRYSQLSSYFAGHGLHGGSGLGRRVALPVGAAQRGGLPY
jgi:hypothetical protein